MEPYRCLRSVDTSRKESVVSIEYSSCIRKPLARNGITVRSSRKLNIANLVARKIDSRNDIYSCFNIILLQNMVITFRALRFPKKPRGEKRNLIVEENRKKVGWLLSYSVRVATLNLSRRAQYLGGRGIDRRSASHSWAARASRPAGRLVDRRYATK